jgi:hypothetical protein
MLIHRNLEGNRFKVTCQSIPPPLLVHSGAEGPRRIRQATATLSPCQSRAPARLPDFDGRSGAVFSRNGKIKLL